MNTVTLHGLLILEINRQKGVEGVNDGSLTLACAISSSARDICNLQPSVGKSLVVYDESGRLLLCIKAPMNKPSLARHSLWFLGFFVLPSSHLLYTSRCLAFFMAPTMWMREAATSTPLPGTRSITSVEDGPTPIGRVSTDPISRDSLRY